MGRSSHIYVLFHLSITLVVEKLVGKTSTSRSDTTPNILFGALLYIFAVTWQH